MKKMKKIISKKKNKIDSKKKSKIWKKKANKESNSHKKTSNVISIIKTFTSKNKNKG